MAPRVAENPKSTAREPEVLFPRRKQEYISSGKQWLKFKRDDDGIGENLWRVHDKLYNLTDFANKHPGGAQWINLTNGTDITEAFEAAHVFGGHEKILEKYFVKDCHMPRKSPLTFHEDGFYKTLQRNVRPVLKQIGTGPSREMILIQDGLVVAFLLMLAVTIKTDSFLAATVTGTILGMTIASSHNFFHQKDNFRRYYWDLGMFSSTDWRITHALSHHLHTNMYTDIEIWTFDPFIEWLPLKDKSVYHKYLAPIVSVILFAMASIIDFLRKVQGLFQGNFEFSLEDAIPMAELTVMFIFSGEAFWRCLQLWLLMHSIGGLWLIFSTLTTTHHHPGVYHAGDVPMNNTDWGLHQMDTVRDVDKGPLFFVATTLGHHLLHHLFPTVDQSKLEQLYPAFEKTCQQFGVQYKFESKWNMVRGTYQQMMRNAPNSYEDRLKLRQQ